MTGLGGTLKPEGGLGGIGRQVAPLGTQISNHRRRLSLARQRRSAEHFLFSLKLRARGPNIIGGPTFSFPS